MINMLELAHRQQAGQNREFEPFEFKIRPSFQYKPSFGEHEPPKEWAGKAFWAVARSCSDKSVWFAATESGQSVTPPSPGCSISMPNEPTQGFYVKVTDIMLPPYAIAEEVLAAEEAGALTTENVQLKNQVGQLESSIALHKADAQQARLERTEIRQNVHTQKDPKCPKCEGEMIVRCNRAGSCSRTFWGCKTWPNCRGTRQLGWIGDLHKKNKKLEEHAAALFASLGDLQTEHQEVVQGLIGHQNNNAIAALRTAEKLKSTKELLALKKEDLNRAIDEIERLHDYVNNAPLNPRDWDKIGNITKQQRIRIAELECIMENKDMMNSMSESQFLEAVNDEETNQKRELIPDERLELAAIDERKHECEHGLRADIAISSFRWSAFQTLVRWASAAAAASIFLQS